MSTESEHLNRDILSIALPSIITNVTTPLLGLIDLSIVGHLGSTVYIGAIALGGMLFNMIYWAFGFLRMGTSGLTAQAFGSRQREEMQLILMRSLTISSLIALTLLLLQYPLLKLSLYLIGGSEEVNHFTASYFYICIWGAPAAMGLYSWTGWFIGMQNSRYPMWVALIQNLTNIAASLFFVYGCGMKVEGVALGTVIAQYTGFGTAVWLGRRLQTGRLSFSRERLFARQALERFFRVNRDIFLRTLCLIAVTAYFTSAGARFGNLTLAANALLIQFFTFFSFFTDGFAYAGEALTGKYIGANRPAAFLRVVKHLFLWGIGLAVVFTLGYAAVGRPFLHLLTDQAEVVLTANDYFYWLLLVPFASITAFVLDGICIGMTDTGKMWRSMFAAACTFFLVYFLTAPAWGNHGLWLAFIAYLAARGLVQGWLMRRRLFR